MGMSPGYAHGTSKEANLGLATTCEDVNIWTECWVRRLDDRIMWQKCKKLQIVHCHAKGNSITRLLILLRISKRVKAIEINLFQFWRELMREKSLTRSCNGFCLSEAG